LGTKYEYWKILMDTGSRLNIVSDTVVSMNHRRPTACPKITTASGEITTRHEAEIDVFLDDKVGVHLVCPIVTGMDCAMYLGTPFFQNFEKHGAKLDTNSERYGYFVSLGDKEIFFPFINSNSPNRMERIDRMQNLLAKMETKKEILKTEENLDSGKFATQIADLTAKFKECCSEDPNAFWHIKKQEVDLPIKRDFSGKLRRSKAVAMNEEQMKLCRAEIRDLLKKGLIRKSKSPIACFAFYVNKHAEIARGKPRLVVNYKPLNDILDYDAYPLPKPSMILAQISRSKIFSKFDLKSGFWQVGIREEDKWKTAFSVPEGHYEWNIMPFSLINAPSAFQRIMDETFEGMEGFLKKYIDDLLIHSDNISDHIKHLKIFLCRVKEMGIVLSESKMKLFRPMIDFLGYNIQYGSYTVIQRSLNFVDNFPDEIKDKTQLQRFLGSLNYISKFIKHCAQERKLLNKRLQKAPIPWSKECTEAVKSIKEKVKGIQPLSPIREDWEKIIMTDASYEGWGAALC